MNELHYGDALRAQLNNILNSAADARTLHLQLAAMLDMRILVKTTYELEGDRLELLLVHDRIEHLRAIGRALRNGADWVLPTVDTVLRETTELVEGVEISKVSP